MSGKTGKGKKKLWFRSYVTVLDSDDKTRELTDKQFRQWHLLLALYRKNEGVMPEEGAIARALLIPARKVAETLAGLRDAGLFEQFTSGEWAPHDWDEHQMESDTSTGRVRAFRERQMKQQRNVSDPTPRNVSETVLPVSPSSFPPDPPITAPSEARGQNSECIAAAAEPQCSGEPAQDSAFQQQQRNENAEPTENTALNGKRKTARAMLEAYPEAFRVQWEPLTDSTCDRILTSFGGDTAALLEWLRDIARRRKDPGDGWGLLVTMARDYSSTKAQGRLQ